MALHYGAVSTLKKAESHLNAAAAANANSEGDGISAFISARCY